jgi:molybdate transport system ATP-binding protein
VCSGFFDSIGLYEPISEHQIRIAKQWLAAAGMDEFGDRPFQGLSYGEQQLTLIARALVKSPLLLILDEPTQGLDEVNRQRVMNLMETLHNRRHTTIMFVSHRLDERLPLFEQHIDLDNT